jgi:hypothetical protein
MIRTRGDQFRGEYSNMLQQNWLREEVTGRSLLAAVSTTGVNVKSVKEANIKDGLVGN